MGDRVTGILLFLPVPAVLLLFTRVPFGAVPSIAAGLALMMTHPLYARPWALRHASHRCLWCGRPVPAATRASADRNRSASTALAVTDPRGTVTWNACADGHRTSLLAMLRFAARHRVLLRAGILGTVTVSLIATVLAERGWLGPFYVSDASALFRLGVGLTVLPLGWLGPRQAERNGTASAPAGSADPGSGGDLSAGALSAPFPLHLAALIGINPVLWLFRLVGFIWLAQGAFHVVERISRG
jgi:hypothetical protein